MLTPNGGVFGRNPKFNNVTVDGDLVSTGGMTVTPNPSAPTSNVTIGPTAGAALNAAATGSILIGSGAGDVVQASANNIALGTNALGAFSPGASVLTRTDAGSGGSANTYTVLLTKDSGDGEMATYPTISATVGAGGTVTTSVFNRSLIFGNTLTDPGSGATVQTGIVLKPADPVPAGFPSNFRCVLTSVIGNSIAIGTNALLLNQEDRNIAIGVSSGDAISTGWANVLIGADSGTSITSGRGNVYVGDSAGASSTVATSNVAIGALAGSSGTSSNSFVAIGNRALQSATTGGTRAVVIGDTAANGATSAAECVVIGSEAMISAATTTNCVSIGRSAGRFAGTGTTSNTGSTSSVYIGHQSRASASANTNEVVIGGTNALGDGSNTTVLGTSDTTQARIRGATFLSTGANGQSTQLGQSTTLLSGLTGATVTATNLIPANCILLGVTARVTTAITGATTFDIGDGTTADRFGDDVAIALNTTSQNCIAPALITAATNVVLTANGSNFTGGAVRLTAHYMTLVAPTS